MNLNLDIQKIEKALADAVKAGSISDNIFQGQRPNTVTDGMADFIVVSVPSAVSDQAAYGQCTCRIEVFVKNLSSGLKNSSKFSIIFSKLNNIFPIKHNNYLFDIFPSIIPLGNDGNGFFVQAVNIQTLIKNI